MRYEISQQGNSTILQVNEERFDAKLAPQFRESFRDTYSGAVTKRCA